MNIKRPGHAAREQPSDARLVAAEQAKRRATLLFLRRMFARARTRRDEPAPPISRAAVAIAATLRFSRHVLLRLQLDAAPSP